MILTVEIWSRVAFAVCSPEITLMSINNVSFAATKTDQNTKPNNRITNSIKYRIIFFAVCTNEENTKKDQKTNLAGEFFEGALQRFHLGVDALKTASDLLLTS